MTKPLPIVGYINPLVADAIRDPTSGINTTQLRAEPNEAVSGAVVMKAEADAVISQLNEIVTGARISIANGNPMKAAYLLEAALKGQEA